MNHAPSGLNRLPGICHRWVNRTIGMVFTLALLIASPAVALGQEAAPAGPAYDIGKSYVYAYAAVLLCIALGVFLVCQPRKREESVESRMDLTYGE